MNSKLQEKSYDGFGHKGQIRVKIQCFENEIAKRLQNPPISTEIGGFYQADGGNRTHNLLITSSADALFYRLTACNYYQKHAVLVPYL